MRIAMWSGPRNLSTAMMYAFGARPDFAVWDEPFYGAYLAATGIDHPLGDDIMAAVETDPNKVAAACVGPIPGGRQHFYMKHMPHHMVDGMPLDWADECVNMHLIRHPARVIASYAAKREAPTMADIGFERQRQIYDRFPGPVIDTVDIRSDPEGMLTRLCDAIGLPFDPAMLSWPVGGHPADGPWARHWYGAIHRSTGFAGPEGPMPDIPEELRPLLAEALPHYEAMAERRL